MLFFTLLLFTGIFLIISLLLRWKKFLMMASKLPGPKGQIPLVGILPHFIGADLHDLFCITMEFIKESKNILKVWFGPELVIVVSNPDLVQKVLNSKECLDKPNFFKYFGIQNASLFGTYDAWKRHRKILNPAFNPLILKEFVPTFDKKSRTLIKNLSEKCELNEEFNVYPYMSIFFLETILSAGLDLEVDIQMSGERDDYVKYFEEFYDATTSRIAKVWLHFEPFYKMTKYYQMEINGRTKSSLKFTEEILEKGKKSIENNNNNNTNSTCNIISVLVDPKHGLCDQEIREEIFSMIMAGQDTTTIIVSSTLLMLAIHKNVQQKVVDELHEVFSTVDEHVDFDILNKLPYLELVIKETMRLFPISAFTLRKVMEDFQLDKYAIPAGAIIYLPVFGLHRDKNYWGEDADLFIPERFEPEKFKNVHPYAYIPFTGEKFHSLFLF